MSDATYEFTAKFSAPDRDDVVEYPSVQTVRSDSDTDAAREELFDKLAGLMGYDSVGAAKSVWQLNSLGVSFNDPPWEDLDELEAEIRGLPGVTSARYEPAMQGDYGPPKFVISADDADAVADAAFDYYSGLTVDRSGERVEILVSPLA